MQTQRPAIFVSSTCYDLKQIRADLREFIESLGYEPILSEFASFPVMPGGSNVENCLAAVRRQATIFLLIVGRRYGMRSGSKSITNLEYLEAHSKGIPIYVFVDRDMLAVLPVWERNPDADYSGMVDTPDLFKFLKELRGSSHTWVLPFDRVQDITNSLRSQWAFLMSQGLAALGRERRPLPSALALITGPARRLLLEQGSCWEHELLLECLNEALAARRELRQDVRHGLVTRVKVIEPGQLAQLALEARPILWGLIRTLDGLFPGAASEALGAGDLQPDAEKVLHVAKVYGRIYEEALNWKLNWRGFECENPIGSKILEILFKGTDNLLTELEGFPQRLSLQITEAKNLINQGIAPTITMTIVFDFPAEWVEQIAHELSLLAVVEGA